MLMERYCVTVFLGKYNRRLMMTMTMTAMLTMTAMPTMTTANTTITRIITREDTMRKTPRKKVMKIINLGGKVGK